MIPINPLFVKIGIVAALVMGSYVAGCSHEKERFDQYKATREAIDQAQLAKTLANNKARKLAKEAADAENKNERDRLNRTINRLRNDLASRDIVPVAPASSQRPEIAAFRREELTGAVREFVTEVQRLLEQGAGAIIDLNSAKKWGQSLEEVP